MAVRLYLDKDSSNRHVTSELRRPGVDVLTTSEVANDELTDELQLQFATGHGRAIYTANVADFARIHAVWLAEDRAHAGIIVRHFQRMPVGQQVRGLVAISGELAEPSVTNAFVYLEDWLRNH